MDGVHHPLVLLGGAQVAEGVHGVVGPVDENVVQAQRTNVLSIPKLAILNH